MDRVVLDANVLVGLMDEFDALAPKARELVARLSEQGRPVVVLDLLLAEALSVVARRARQRRASPPDLGGVLSDSRQKLAAGEVSFVSGQVESFFDAALVVMQATQGALNFNDALLVVLQREGIIGAVATFDEGFAAVPDFRRVAHPA